MEKNRQGTLERNGDIENRRFKCLHHTRKLQELIIMLMEIGLGNKKRK